jgi:long-chain acyl-CoA synthetase
MGTDEFIPHYKAKMIEHIDLIPKEARIRAIKRAGYNVFLLKAEEIFIDCDGWLHTADLGYINEKGELFLTGRKRYIIKTRHGENIYPIDIERVLHSHKLVKEAAVVGRKGQDDDYEEIAAFVVLKEDLDEEYSYNELGSGLLESGLKEYCKLKLSSFKIPHKIYFIVELPKNIFGKVLKNELPKY